jgi:hypothetical protein
VKRHQLLAVALGLLSAAFAPAQGAPPAKDLLLARQIFIALRPNVSKELNLTGAQGSKIEDAFDGSLKVDGDRVMLTMTGDTSLDDMVTAAMKVLEPVQKTRLKEIWLQESGSLAILDPALAKELGVSKDQVEKATKVAESIASKIMDLFQDMSGDHEVAAKKVKALRDDARKQVDVLLTEDQRKKLETMKGKPFKFEKDGVG